MDQANNVNTNDLGLGVAPMPMTVLMATVGWTSQSGGGPNDHVDVGATTNDGTTLVKITTYAGRTPGDSLKPAQAQGHEYLAQVMGPLFNIPKKGARVLVAFPAGMETTPGAAVILGTVGGGAEVKRNTSPGDLVFSNGAACLVLKANGVAALTTTQDGTATGKLMSIMLRPDGLPDGAPGGLVYTAPHGGIKLDSSGYHMWTKSGGVAMDMGGISIPGVPGPVASALSGYVRFTAPTFTAYSSFVKLGIGPVYATALGAPSAAIASAPVPVTTGSLVTGGSQSSGVFVSTT